MHDHPTEKIWGYAREDYLKGLPVTRLCTGYSLARSSFYARARREGWLRPDDCHEAEHAGELRPPPVAPPPAPPLQVMAQQALDQAAAALAAGDVRAIGGWLRAVERLRTMLIAETGAQSWGEALASLDKAEKSQPVLDKSGHCKTPETQALQGIVSPKLDSPNTKNSDAGFIQPPPITPEEIAAAEAEFERLTAEIRALRAADGFAHPLGEPP